MEFVQENNLVSVKEIIEILDTQENTIELNQEIKDEILCPSANENQEELYFNDQENEKKAIELLTEYILNDGLELENNIINDLDTESDNSEDLEDVEKIVLKDVIIILNPDDVIIKKKRYTDAHRRAQKKYRESHPEKTKEHTKKTYETLKQNKEWVEEHNRRNREYQKKKYDERKAELIASGVELKPRGRPRKQDDNKKQTENIEKHIDV